ncbi:MAG: 30S ribosome-binding factor RbfA [Bacteroidota bacterium]
MSETTRQQKFSRLIQRDLGTIFQKDKMSLFSNTFITVADVKMSPDLGIAKVYLSMLLVEDTEEKLNAVNQHKNEIRRELGRLIGKQVRKIPELIFYLDDVEENATKIDRIIDALDIPDEEEDEI